MVDNTNRMKFEELKCCPFCGHDEHYESMPASGFVIFRSRFDGEAADNEDMYAYVDTKSSGRTYCSRCNRYLGNHKRNIVGREAERAVRSEKRKNDG